MSQMQTFEFLSTLASLKLPETVSDKQDYFSEADAAAWAKEAEAAGLKEDLQDEAQEEPAEKIMQAHDHQDSASTTGSSEENADSDVADSALAYSSTAQDIAKDLWLDSIQEEPNTDALIKSQLNETTETEALIDEVAGDAGVTDFEAQELSLQAEEVSQTDEAVAAEESPTYSKSLLDDGMRIIEDAKFDAEAPETSTSDELQTADNVNSEAGTEQGQDSESDETMIVSAAESLEMAAIEFEEELEHRQQLEASLTEELSETEMELPEVAEVAGSLDFESAELGLQTGKGVGTSESAASKMVTKIAKAYAAMQARANSIAAQQSFTLRGNEFGGQLDIKIRNTGRGLDLTLMPQMLSQAGALTGSLRQIKDLLNNRGITTQRVQLDTDKLTDFWGLNRERFVDTTFFSGMEIANDNLSSNGKAIRESAFSVAELTNQGELV